MTSKQGGIALLVVALICAFVAIERYQDNAAKVEAMRDSPLTRGLMEGLVGKDALEPAMPAATKYAIFFGVLSLVGGGWLLLRSREPAPDELERRRNRSDREPPR